MQTTKPCCAAWSWPCLPCRGSRRSHWAARGAAAPRRPIPTTMLASTIAPAGQSTLRRWARSRPPSTIAAPRPPSRPSAVGGARAAGGFRAIAGLCQTLLALTGVYLLKEKGAVAAVDGFALSPPDFAKRVASLFADLGSGNHAAGLDRLQELIVETRGLSSRR